MAEPTLAGIFGSSATQSSTELVISKSDLAAVGLTADANNTPESLLAAIVALAQLALTEVAYDANLDQSIVISSGTDSLVSRNNVTYRQSRKTLEFFKPDNAGTFDPDDY